MFWEKQKKIITHSGRFHTDDVFAVATITLVLGEGHYTIIRTRDEKFFSIGDYVVDVGGVYDEKNNRFDHHQEGGAGKWENGVPLSSFGLVWKKFGGKLSGSVEIAEEIRKKLVEPIDAVDNGVSQYSLPEGIFTYTIDDLIDDFLPGGDELSDVNAYDKKFLKAVAFAQEVIRRRIYHEKARKKEEEEVFNLYQKTPDKRYLIAGKQYPRSFLAEQNRELLYTVAPRFESSGWSVGAVRKNPDSFELRKPLPLAWAGKRDKELEKITGVKGAIFCHNNRFIAIADTKDGAVKLLHLALEA